MYLFFVLSLLRPPIYTRTTTRFPYPAVFRSVCTRAIIIADGMILADATPAELLAQSRYAGALSVRAADTVAVRSALEGLAGVAGLETDPVDGRMIVLAVPGYDLFAAVSGRLRERGVALDRKSTRLNSSH